MEPEKYHAVIEFCTIGGFFDMGDPCPDCTGHAVKRTTPEWDAWDALRKQAQVDEWRTQRRRRNKGPGIPPDEKRCVAVTLTGGERCARSVALTGGGLCPVHAKSRDRLQATQVDEKRVAYVAQFNGDADGV